MDRKLYIFPLVLALLCGCAKESVTPSEAGEIQPGDAVMFTTCLPDAIQTKSARSEWEQKVNAYKAVCDKYTFNIEMLKSGESTATGSSTYVPVENEESASGYDEAGTLTHSGNTTALYWPDNSNAWGFKATSVSSSSIDADQSTQQKWLYQDLLAGHSYLPLWTGDEDTGSGTDPEQIQYKTSKQWYADNKTAKDLSGLMVSSNADYKKVPLYMKHQRAWITVILKAGEGVKREALYYATSADNITMAVNSYADESGTMVKTAVNQPLSSEEKIHYDADKNGAAADNVSTTRYDAIVMPHDYTTKKDEEAIANVSLSSQNFSFYASNDNRYVNSSWASEDEARSVYNLDAGKHLTIVATLTRESRKILITAWIEDWTEVATQTICDDYGQNGDPVVIKNRKELIDFLTDETVNKQGSVGIIQPTELKLDVEAADETNPDKYPAEWPGYNLNATLNLAGCKLITSHQFLKDMSSSANLVNGTLQIADGATVDCAVASTNEGTIERVNVVTTGELSTAKATVAGMVKVNHGTIYQCTSELAVNGTAGLDVSGNCYVGGIAAESTSKDGSSMAVIDGCTVNAQVDGSSNIYGGGIVGYVTGRVSNNCYEYGVSISQDVSRFKNVFAQAGGLDTRAYGNGWPTIALNPISSSDETTNPNVYTGAKFNAVLDSQEQLHKIMSNVGGDYNKKDANYRISRSFSVSSTDDPATDWTHGTVNASEVGATANNVMFNLDGNGKTITLTGTKTVKTTDGEKSTTGNVTTYTTAPMLFNCIVGEVKNLIINLEKPLVAKPSTNSEDGYTTEDAIAPLAYAVYCGADGVGKITNVKVKGETGTYVQASTAAGLVVWAYGGSTISNCKVNIPVKMWLPKGIGQDAKHYSGGIVACAAKATLDGCQYLGNTENSISGAYTGASSSNYFLGGIVGGTSPKENEEPLLEIVNCSSWYLAKRAGAGAGVDQSSKGGIIAYCCYAKSDSQQTITNGMGDSNQGNWWQINAIGAHTWASGMSEEKVIGKKNSVAPTYNAQY